MNDFQKITSRQNERLTAVRRVRDGKDPARIFIEGARLAAEALRSGLDIETCIVNEDRAGSTQIASIVERSKESNAAKVAVGEKIFNSLCDTRTPQGIILIAQRPESGARKFHEAVQKGAAPIVVFLDRVNDPSNLGAVMRTAEAAGAAGVIVSEGSADAFSPKSIRASMGSAFRIKVWEGAELLDAVEWARRDSFQVAAADVSGDAIYTKIDLSSPTLVLFGSEAHGLDPGALGSADTMFRIPLKNAVESLNLAVSVGIVLFEAARQRGY